MIGSLLPIEGDVPKFAQLYIHDTQNEIYNRIYSVRYVYILFIKLISCDFIITTKQLIINYLLHICRKENDRLNIHVEVVNDIKGVLDENNVLVQSFRMAKAKIEANPCSEIKMRLIGKQTNDARNYNLPSVSEVAALIVGDLDPTIGLRDILVESRSGQLKRISELNPACLPLQYPVLFSYGEDRYREDIPFAGAEMNQNRSRHRISPREFFAFHIHERLNEISTTLYAMRQHGVCLVSTFNLEHPLSKG